ncbi:MAG: DUF1684 domain-containing protein [Terracidiphilus sp.]|nr:DUF1684 domain-containing protein [Terracidiphilus sp.]
MTRRLRSFVLILAAAALVLPVAAQTLSDPDAWRSDLQNWRALHEKSVSAPSGWLSLTALDWLKPGINSVGSDPTSLVHLPATAPARVGLITVSSKTVQLLSPAGGFPAGLTVNGQPAREDVLSTSDSAPSTIAIGSISMVIMERAGRFVARVKDSGSPARAAFHGLNWFPPDPKLVVLARWIPYNPVQTAEIPTALGNSLRLPAPGVAVMMLDDEIVQIEPVVEDPQFRSLLFILRDTTSTSSTYPGGRFLHTQIPDHGLDQPGTLVLDFNRLENPPCAYTPYATCPLPPQKNRLGVSIEAGEKRYTP